jgi:hypothetical protein
MEAKILFRAALAASRSARSWAACVALTWLAFDQSSAFGQAPAGGIPPATGGALKEAPKTDGNGAGRTFRGFMPGGSGPSGGPSPVVVCDNLVPISGGTAFGSQFISGGGQQLGIPRIVSKIDANTPLQKLLPAPPVLPEPRPPWLVTDLTQVPEVFFEKPLEVKGLPADFQEKTCAEKGALVKEINEARQKAREHVARTLAHINHLNEKDMDRFVRLLMESRPDLAGLPFMLGVACRMNKAMSRQFVREVAAVAANLPGGGQLGFGGGFGGQFGALGGFPGQSVPSG